MKPYYEEKGIVIYHGDCREVLPTLEPVDAVVVDPPYGINYVHSGGGKGVAARRNASMPIVGDQELIDISFLFDLQAKEFFIFGADHFRKQLPDGGTFIAWDKHCGSGPNDKFIDAEFAWTNRRIPRNVIRFLWKGVACVKAGEANGSRQHPTQKPIALMRKAISLLPDIQSLVDPFMGSGSTLRAAKDLGLRAIGIEIEEKYCEIAANRLRQEVLDFG